MEKQMERANDGMIVMSTDKKDIINTINKFYSKYKNPSTKRMYKKYIYMVSYKNGKNYLVWGISKPTSSNVSYIRNIYWHIPNY